MVFTFIMSYTKGIAVIPESTCLDRKGESVLKKKTNIEAKIDTLIGKKLL